VEAQVKSALVARPPMPTWPSNGLCNPGLRAAIRDRFLVKAKANAESVRAEASPDEVLVAAAKAGSPQAFSRLVARHQQAVRAFLRRACGDAALADDLAQETFLAAWSQIGRFDGRSTFRSWLCGIAYRKRLGDRRSTMRSLRRDGDWAQAQALSIAEGAGHEDRLALQSAMTALPLEQRAAVALCLAADFSHAEAADALGLPLGTVKSHVARGRLKLLERLGAADV
jgi:RNA polymerase sigma factor (sigma-70 family)